MIIGKRDEFTITNHEYRKILADGIGFSWYNDGAEMEAPTGVDSIIEILWGLDAWDEYRFFHFDGKAQIFL
jgi:hypothetical protein